MTTNPLFEVFQSDDIVDEYPVDAESKSVSVTTRIPVSWLAAIDEIREMPNSPFPNQFPTRSDFFRKALLSFMKYMQRRIEEGGNQADPIHSGRMFVAKVSGRQAARSKIVKDNLNNVKELAGAVDILIRTGDYTLAADEVNLYVDSVIDVHDDWREHFLRQLFLDADLIKWVRFLMDEGYLVNDVLAEKLGRPLEQQDLFFG